LALVILFISDSTADHCCFQLSSLKSGSLGAIRSSSARFSVGSLTWAGLGGRALNSRDRLLQRQGLGSFSGFGQYTDR